MRRGRTLEHFPLLTDLASKHLALETKFMEIEQTSIMICYVRGAVSESLFFSTQLTLAAELSEQTATSWLAAHTVHAPTPACRFDLCLTVLILGLYADDK